MIYFIISITRTLLIDTGIPVPSEEYTVLLNHKDTLDIMAGGNITHAIELYKGICEGLHKYHEDCGILEGIQLRLVHESGEVVLIDSNMKTE